MWKRIAGTAVPLLVLAVVALDISQSRFYPESDIERARELSVQMARDGDLQQALQRLSDLSRVAPDNQAVWADYITVLVWARDHSRALSLSRKLARSETPSYTLRALLDAALNSGDGARALLEFDELLRRDDYSVEQVQADAVALLAAGLRPQLAERFGAMRERFADSAGLQFVLALASANGAASEVVVPALDESQRLRLAVALGDLAGVAPQLALRGLTALQQRYPTDPALAERLLLARAQAGQQGTVAALYRAQGHRLHSERALAAAAPALLTAEDYAGARDAYQRLLELAPDNEHYRAGLVAALSAVGDETALQAALLEGAEDGDADALRARAASFRRQGDSAREAQALEALLRQQPEAGLYRQWFAALAAGDYRANREALQRWLPGTAPLDVLRGYIELLIRERDYAQLRQLVGAGGHAQLVLPALAHSAGSARQRQRHDEAVALYRLGAELAPAQREFAIGLALSHSEAGRTALASRQFQSLLQRYPGDASLRDAAIYHYRRAGDSAALLAVLERELVSRREPGDYLNSWIAALRGVEAYADPARQLAKLDGMQARWPRNSRLRSERLALLAELQRCDELASEVGLLTLAQPGRSELERAAFAARRCNDHPRALALYRRGMAAYPGDSVFSAGAVLALTELGRADEAAALAGERGDRHAGDIDFLRAAAYLQERRGDDREAIARYDQLLASAPDDRDAFVARALAYNRLGEHERAVELARQRPEWFTVDDWKRLYGDRAALAVRRLDGADAEARGELRETAFAYLEAYQRYLRDHDSGDIAAQRFAEYDRMVALGASGRHAEVEASFRRQRLPAEQLPVYALLTLADARLALRQPEAALEVLAAAEQQQPDSPRLLSAQFYAYLDSEQYARAGERLQRLEAVVGGGEPLPAGHWLRRQRAMFSAFRNRLAPAQRDLEQQAAAAPDSGAVQLNLATIYRWRGWAERSLPLYRAQPGAEARVGEAYALLDLQRYPEVDQLLTELRTQAPGRAEVRRLSEDWRRHNMRKFETRFMRGRSTGSAFGSRDLVLDSHLFSQPLRHHYRAFAHHRYAWAEVPEGTARQGRLGAGLERRGERLDWRAEVSSGVEGQSDTGLSVDGSWRFDDHWQLSAGLQSFSLEVPLRALRADIDGESASLGLQYRWHESRQLNLAYHTVDFSDDNRRQSLSLAHRHRIYQNEHHRLSLIEQAYTSRNSERVNSPYFNPERDWSAGLAAEYHGIIHRRYQRQWSHRLTLGLGNYHQRDVGGSAIWDADYEHRWQLSRELSAGLGLLHRQRTYDGDDEAYSAIYGSLNWRF